MPWSLTGINYNACGLREAVARVRYLAPSDLKRVYAANTKPTLLRTVAQWRLETPEKFEELCQVINVAYLSTRVRKQKAA